MNVCSLFEVLFLLDLLQPGPKIMSCCCCKGPAARLVAGNTFRVHFESLEGITFE